MGSSWAWLRDHRPLSQEGGSARVLHAARQQDGRGVNIPRVDRMDRPDTRGRQRGADHCPCVGEGQRNPWETM